jgi:drug/metabolite transporter (DMT)-like permease
MKFRINIQDNYKAGILFIILSSISFALMALLVKEVGHLPLMEIVFLRNIPTMLIVPLMIKKTSLSFLGNNKFILLFRSFIVTISLMASFYTYTVMSLTDAITLEQLSPFFVFFLAGIFLHEKISLRQLPFFILAFLGVLLVIKPGLRLDIIPAFIALVGAICAAVSSITLRHLRLTDHYLVIVNYFAYISSAVSLIILLIQQNFQLPSLSDCLVLILLGGIGLLAQITNTKAYQLAPASLVSLYNYSEIIFVSLFSLLSFKEIPDLLSIIGASFIIISGYFNYKMKTKDQV